MPYLMIKVLTLTNDIVNFEQLGPDHFMSAYLPQDSFSHFLLILFSSLSHLYRFFFTIGEDLTDIFILSKGKTECVIINSAQFSIQGKSELLRTLKRDREAVLPSNSELYRKFQLNRKWNNYRQQLVNDILARKRNHFSRSYVQL